MAGCLTPAMYSQMVAVAGLSDGLRRQSPALADVASCVTVRRALRTVGQRGCPRCGGTAAGCTRRCSRSRRPRCSSVQRGHGSRAAQEQELHIRQELGHGLRLRRRDYERPIGAGCLAGWDAGSRDGRGGRRRREAVVRPAHALTAERRRSEAAASLQQHHSVLDEAEVEANLAEDQVRVRGCGHRPSGNHLVGFSFSPNQGTNSCNAQGPVPPLGIGVWVLGEAGKDATLEIGDVEAAEGADGEAAEGASVRFCVIGAVAVGREELGAGDRAEITGEREMALRRQRRKGNGGDGVRETVRV
jgi:hypothetical protein